MICTCTTVLLRKTTMWFKQTREGGKRPCAVLELPGEAKLKGGEGGGIGGAMGGCGVKPEILTPSFCICTYSNGLVAYSHVHKYSVLYFLSSGSRHK